jgi:OOP family OmpA-OmpF porin
LGLDNARLVPYIVASVGGAGYFDISSKYYTERNPVQSEARVSYLTGNTPSQSSSYAAVLSGGLGLDYRISKQWTLRYQAEAGYTTSDKNDMFQGGKLNDGQLQHSLGVVFTFGKPKAKAVATQAVQPIEEKRYNEIESKPFVEEKKPVVEEKPQIVEQKEAPVVENILFKIESAEIESAYLPGLENVAEFLLAEKPYTIILKGHADATGSDDFNMNLSRKRAETVQHFLERKGVAANRIETKFFGENLPVADNATKEGRKQNRRVEIEIK